jgi:hypothetical protein
MISLVGRYSTHARIPKTCYQARLKNPARRKALYPSTFEYFNLTVTRVFQHEARLLKTCFSAQLASRTPASDLPPFRPCLVVTTVNLSAFELQSSLILTQHRLTCQ